MSELILVSRQDASLYGLRRREQEEMATTLTLGGPSLAV